MVDSTTDDEQGSASGDPQHFASLLDELKQAGCVVLVTGDVDATVRAASSRRLFGTTSRSHQRVVIHPDNPALRLASYLPHGTMPTSSAVRCIADTQLWGDATAQTDSTSPTKVDAAPEPLPPSGYSQQLTDLLTNIERTAEGFAPGELRVGFLDLSEFLEQHGQARARTLLTTVGHQMRTLNGIGHCHLPVPSESAVATALAESVAIHICLREHDGHPPEQRWHLRDDDCYSAWLPLDLYMDS